MGGRGQARVWGQVIGTGAGGQMESLAALYLTRASSKATILAEGGEWVVGCCEARSRGGVSIVVSGGDVTVCDPVCADLFVRDCVCFVLFYVCLCVMESRALH